MASGKQTTLTRPQSENYLISRDAEKLVLLRLSLSEVTFKSSQCTFDFYSSKLARIKGKIGSCARKEVTLAHIKSCDNNTIHDVVCCSSGTKGERGNDHEELKSKALARPEVRPARRARERI